MVQSNYASACRTYKITEAGIEHSGLQVLKHFELFGI